LDEDQKLCAEFFLSLRRSDCTEAIELMKIYQETFNLEDEYDRLFELTNMHISKYTKEYKNNGAEGVAQLLKRDLITSQKKPL
jgi:hypothetical protein